MENKFINESGLLKLIQLIKDYIDKKHLNDVTGVKGNNETNYRTGNVNITKSNIGLSEVDNTSDVNKPISNATQLALDLLVVDIDSKSFDKDPTVPDWVKSPTKPEYTASEVGALPDDTFIPTKVSDLENDSSYIDEETDPTVPSWAKAESKPTYTASEVGALPDSTEIPSSTSDLENDSGFVTIPFVNLDGRGVKDHIYDIYQGNGAGILLTDGQLLLVRLTADVNAIGETMYINIDPNHNVTNNKQIFYMNSTSGQLVVKVGDFPRNSQLLLRFYGNSNMWIVIGSGDKPFDTSDLKTVNNNSLVGSGNVSVGTITGITMNGASKGTSDVVDLGTVITSETPLSIDSRVVGNGNAITNISVNGHVISLTKDSTFLTQHQSLTSLADGIWYDSKNKRIYLKNGNSNLTGTYSYIDATDFIKDGMVSNVTVDTPSTGPNSGTLCLIITFNTDAGADNIELPISNIFDANNYYNKTEVDTSLSNKVRFGKINNNNFYAADWISDEWALPIDAQAETPDKERLYVDVFSKLLYYYNNGNYVTSELTDSDFNEICV